LKLNNSRVRYLTIDEATLLLDALKLRSIQTYQMALLSLNSGMRFGEIAALKWQHVNEDRREIIVLDPKGGESRHVYMTDAVVEMFLSMLRRYPNNLVFPARTMDGEDEKMKDTSDTFKRTVQDLGLNDGISDRRMKVVFHSLRHTCASWLVNQGVPIPVIAKILGHKTLAMTMRYSHVNDESVIDAMALLDKQQKTEKVISISRKKRA
jgi:integrase